ncbi:MAG: hypothetical protein SFY66_19975 [Oculatellaceae cyanobacterium bins.114]|nr:hypothetical protein [Oculatellaceae cyanobacterium bins.114]
MNISSIQNLGFGSAQPTAKEIRSIGTVAWDQAKRILQFITPTYLHPDPKIITFRALSTTDINSFSAY